MKLRNPFQKFTALEILGLLLLGAGFISLFYGTWQKDMLTVPALNRSVDDRIGFYTDLKNDGYKMMWDMPWTISVLLFPNMTAGLAFDVCDILIWSSWFLTAVGAYLVHQQIVIIVDKAKKTIKRKV